MTVPGIHGWCRRHSAGHGTPVIRTVEHNFDYRTRCSGLTDGGQARAPSTLWAPASLAASCAAQRGLIEHDSQVVGPACWQPVVTEAEWRAVCAILADPGRRTTPGPDRHWQGSGIYLCGAGHGRLGLVDAFAMRSLAAASASAANSQLGATSAGASSSARRWLIEIVKERTAGV